MIDKVQKIREEVERLKRWNNNVRNSTRHMTLQEEDFNRGKHSSYLEILNFIDSLQEEPVSEDLEKVVEEIVDPTVLNAYGTKELARRLRNTICGTSVSEDLEEAIDTYLKSYWGGEKEKQEWPFLKKMVIYFTNLQKEQMMAKAVDGVITFDYYGDDDKTYGCIAHDSFCLEDFGLKDTDKVKMILIKED